MDEGENPNINKQEPVARKKALSDDALKRVPLPPLPAYATESKTTKREEEIETGTLKASKITAEDVNKMMNTFNKIYDEIELKMEEVYQKTGWTADFLKSYVNNANNFSDKQWDRLQGERQSLKKNFRKGQVEQEEKMAQELKGVMVPMQQLKPDEKTAQKRRSKTGAARRNWIPIR